MSALKLAIIIGSVRDGRFGPVVADWFAAQVDDRFDVDVIDLAEFDLPAELPAVPPAMDPDPARPSGMVALSDRLAAADAYVVLTPEYNRSYPSALKTAIDWHFTQWDRKTIGFVGYSGGTGGVLAIEHLRQVFNELNAHTVRDYVSFPRYYLLFDEGGRLREPEGFEAAAKAMLDQLFWWATALAGARSVAVSA
ncbi:NAD(P)H-dependent oxidoreductase [Nocardia sp. NPDC050378]|uniref:NADPH-dependent FMN reductase n=1 Tax=Nocardia sp. NPDC050378 TaxID=3155400 RepID=UPI0033D10F1C